MYLQLPCVITANKKDSTINIFKAINTCYKVLSTKPILKNTGVHMPWEALSGLTSDGTYFYTVPDSVFGELGIFRINTKVTNFPFYHFDIISDLSLTKGICKIIRR